jgi:YD repeat-containing protein
MSRAAMEWLDRLIGDIVEWIRRIPQLSVLLSIALIVLFTTPHRAHAVLVIEICGSATYTCTGKRWSANPDEITSFWQVGDNVGSMKITNPDTGAVSHIIANAAAFRECPLGSGWTKDGAGNCAPPASAGPPTVKFQIINKGLFWIDDAHLYEHVSDAAAAFCAHILQDPAVVSHACVVHTATDSPAEATLFECGANPPFQCPSDGPTNDRLTFQAPATCPSGYTSQGTPPNCNLTNASAAKKPADNICQVVKVGNVWTNDPQDPDCDTTVANSAINQAQITGLGTGSLSAGIADAGASYVANPDGTTNLDVSAPNGLGGFVSAQLEVGPGAAFGSGDGSGTVLESSVDAAGETFGKNAGACLALDQAADDDPNRPQVCPIGNPINAFTGNKYQTETDYVGVGAYPLRFARYYNSKAATGSGHVGANWRHSFDRSISVSGTSATVTRADGKQLVFTQSGPNWIASADVMDRLVQVPSGWTYIVAPNDESESYDTNGRLLSISNRSGVSHVMAYDANGRLASVMNSVNGRSLRFLTDSLGRVTVMTDPSGNTFGYSYDAHGDLSSVTYPDDTADTTDNPVRSYVYNEPENTSGANLLHALTGIVDEKSVRFATFRYAADRRVLSTEHSGGVSRYSVAYTSATSSTITDPLNTVRNYGFQNILDVPKQTGSDQPCDRCGLASSISYDANGYLSGATNFNGVAFSYVHDARGLETSRTDAVGTPQVRTISTQWHEAFRLPVKIAVPFRITSYVYNGDAGMNCGSKPNGSIVPGVLCSMTMQATSDATGSLGFSATPVGPARTLRYTYNGNGSMLTVDGPRTDVSDVTTYTYYANEDPDLGKRGNIATITNAQGQVTSISAYNAHGQPLTIVDPNGLTTALTYDARLRLTSRNVGGESTTYSYDATGQLVRVTLPDGSFLAYTYDPAHRLTGIADSSSNRIAYTLDAMGNRTKEEVFDPLGTLAQTRSRTFNTLNRLAQEIGAASQTTTYAYDNQGNVVTVTDPLTHQTANAYDALNRLVRVTDPGLGVTQYGYNGLDQLSSVTDPRTLITSYAYDGLSNLNQQSSPDTGSTTNTYDTAGNLLTQTDAKGQVTTYAYDALNRVTSITFHDGSKQTYAYDQGTNGIGRLTGITELDPALAVKAQIAYAYEAHGRVASETRTIAGIAYVTSYSYDPSGRLSGLTYPSGRTVSYGFDALGRILSVSTVPPNGSAQTVVSNVAYQPFGDVKSYTLGNGHLYTRGYDTDGRIASYSLGNQIFAIGYDAASRISFIADAGNPTNANTYGYDALDRLTSAVLPNTPFAYSYDAVGNRLSKTVGSSTDTYAYGSTNNRIASITAQAGATRAFGFDPNGSTVNDGVNQYAYDARGRMVQSVGALGTTTYQVNALGQRIRKTNSSEDRVFLYDTKGHVVAETDPGGGLKREYLYLGDIPIAVVQ